MTNNNKAKLGNFFEDFTIGQELIHATPRTVTFGDVAVYNGLFGSRFAVQSSDDFAQNIGYPQSPIDDFLVFHIIFGKSVPDISLNAVANLGYAGGIFGVPVFAGDTLRSVSEVTGLKENSSGENGVVYVKTTGFNQKDEIVLTYHRHVMVKKRDIKSPAPSAFIPDLPDHVTPDMFETRYLPSIKHYDFTLAGSVYHYDDYQIGEIIDHHDGITIEESDHMMATRLYQNTAKIHFNAHTERESRFGQRLIYGGHVLSMARSLSFNGLENAFKIASINGGRHANPLLAGDTIYARTEILDKYILEHPHYNALRLRLIAFKNLRAEAHIPLYTEDKKPHKHLLLDFDYTGIYTKKIRKIFLWNLFLHLIRYLNKKRKLLQILMISSKKLQII